MSAIERAWETGGGLATLLRPFGAAYRGLVAARAFGYRAGWFRVVPSPLPVVVVGNLSVGGTGKTPLTVHLVDEFRRRGWHPGVVSRGYGGVRHETPRHVRADDMSRDVGDEPLMVHRASGVPVCVCVHRARAVAALSRDTDCDLVLSDDGLQHLEMAREVEIVVVDGRQGFGNARSLPAGPLRESPSRLLSVDLVAVRDVARAGGGGEPADRARAPGSTLADVPGIGAVDAARLPPAFRFSLGDAHASRWPDGERVPLARFAGRRVHAVAGIARPERFFSMLREHGLVVDARPLPDHHPIGSADLAFDGAEPVFVTRKDAVRLGDVAPLPAALHVVDVSIETDAAAPALLDALSDALRRGRDQGPDARSSGGFGGVADGRVSVRGGGERDTDVRAATDTEGRPLARAVETTRRRTA